MVFTSKKSAALLVLVSSASLFSADYSVSIDNASFIKKLQTQCEVLNGLLREWTINKDNIETVEKTRKEICNGFMQIWPLNDLRDQNDAPTLLLPAIYNDAKSILITHVLGVYPHINTMFTFLSENGGCPKNENSAKQYLQYVQAIKNYIIATGLIKAQEEAQGLYSVGVTIDQNITIYNPIGLLTQAAKQTQNDAVKIIIYEKLVAEQEKKAHNNDTLLLQSVTLCEENSELLKLNQNITNEIKKDKEIIEELEQQKVKIEKECAFSVEKLQAIIDILRKQADELKKSKDELKKSKEVAELQVVELAQKNAELNNENEALRHPHGILSGWWYGGSSKKQ